MLVSRLERIGERFGLSEALLGLLAALAADAPEITSSVSALLHGERLIGAGVAGGSNVFNLAALLGLGAVVAGTIALHRRAVLLNGTVALYAAVMTWLVLAGRLEVAPAIGLVPGALALGIGCATRGSMTRAAFMSGLVFLRWC